MHLSNILIAGSGQLGSRYLQGLFHCVSPLNILVYDTSLASLEIAQKRWVEVAEGKKSIHQVQFTSDLTKLFPDIEVAIVATPASVRSSLVQKISSISQVRYWILEKVLTQNQSQLEDILKFVEPSKTAWVNTFRRAVPWNSQIKATLNLNQPLRMSVDGGEWGLACNSVHFLDLLTWLTGEELVSLDPSGLESNWVQAKRTGNFEIFGSLKAVFSKGSTLDLTANPGEVFYFINIKDSEHIWKISEDHGTAIRSDGLQIPGKLPFQSEMTAQLIDGILKNGHCDLPRLKDVAPLHQLFITTMLMHWNKSRDASASYVPIT